MAAPSGTIWGSIVGGYGRIGLYTSLSNNDTTTTVNVQVWFWSKYSVSDSNNTLYFNDLASSGSATTSLGSKTIKTTSDSGGWASSNAIKLYDYSKTYTRGNSGSTRYIYAKLTGVDRVGGTMTASATVYIPKVSSYTVSYNANGGSGAPSSQTKWHGTSLTLSNTAPTRAGHTFSGWSTSASSTTVSYKPGASYTNNASITLYAVWIPMTYVVTYNANGGSGAPSAQTKTYGKTLTLSSTKPTRTNYLFKGWGTSASSTTVSYQPGASYTNNANITLYAVWELNYAIPRITNFFVVRCTSDGATDDTGTYAMVHFNWACDKTVSSIKIEWKLTSETSWTSVSVSASGTSSEVFQVVGSGGLNTESTYNFKVTVTDGGGSFSMSSSLGGTKYPIDILYGGKGVAFGKPSELSDYMDVGYNTYFRENVVVEGAKTISARSLKGKGDVQLFAITGNDELLFGLGGYEKSLPTYVNGQDVFLRANNLVQCLSPVQINDSTNDNPTLSVGAPTGYHVEFRGANIQSKASKTSNGSLHFNDAGGNVHINGCVMAKNKVLWSGAWYMHATQTATLSESISTQANGIVLVWSYYNEGVAQDYNWNTQFIPKYMVSTHSGTGFSTLLTSATATYNTAKYLYIKDTSIAGYDGNDGIAATQSSNIFTTPTKFVLRYVIGV